MQTPSDLENVYDGDWRLFEYDPMTGVKKWYLDLGTHFVIRTDTPVDELFDRNAELNANSIGKRWGDGQVAASIPLDVFYGSGLAEAQKQGDDRFIKRFLNDSDNAKFRTFRGKV